MMSLIFFALGYFGFSQTEEQVLSKEVEELLLVAPKTYLKINKALKPYRRDTIALNRFIQSALENNYQAGYTYALNQKGTVYRNLSEFKRAIALHQEALVLSEEIENKEFIVLSLNMLGVVYRRMDAIKTALDYHHRALELAEIIENPSVHIKRHINISFNSIGNLYHTLGQYDLAITQFKKALELEGALNNKLGLAINNQNIGEANEQKGQLDIALDYYRKSLALNDEINNKFGQVLCKNSIAQVYLKQDMPSAALALLQTLKEPATNLGDKFLLSSVLINLGWAELDSGTISEAEKNIVKGRKLASASNMPSLVMYADLHLSDLEEKRENFSKALEYQKEAKKIYKEITNDRNLSYVNDLILKYQSDRKNSQISELAQENELVKSRLRKNQTTILVSTLIIGLIGTILFIMYRQSQSNYEKRVLGLEQHMLRSQMNPHFLFNSLNSIKLYIINNDKKNAVHYLNKFSKLVRRILEGSALKETQLSEELETAELYLNIENIRFSDEIEYSIEVADDINAEQVKIPSLVLQPFLENAIWHGLSSKEANKKIWVIVAKKDSIHLQISIIDNGVGRKVSEEIKENRVLKRNSVGIDITKERLANFAKDYQNDFSIDIIDLFNEEGNSRGTKIILEIPMV
ncbi:tetratricopeptide repeat protein [Croceitalea sp. P059]|uniref:tetratricopeptide repeat-containing sensor histidine kinase n=1 Tax=Croceitalea sp. P059 TaxID=3075601 RepID=UPI002884F304|nr:tetratricopeptide repeat protein [Croceitalea sp. P059]MDT0538894.1 tetratricopeptide repeat protein [Croceitalea sp. P059]